MPALPGLEFPAETQPKPEVERANFDIETAKTEVPPKSVVASYFQPDGEFLAKLVADYKGSSWAEQQRRFVLLYVKAYSELMGKPMPSDEHIKEAAQKASVLDTSNFAKYLAALRNKELTKIAEGLVLSLDGQRAVEVIVNEMDDQSVKSGFAYWARTPSDRVERHRLDSEEREKIKSWASEDVGLGKLDTSTIRSSRDYAILALWILTVHLKKSAAVSWNVAYYYYKAKFTAISATQNAFSRALGRKGNNEFFRTSDAGYFLTPKAIQLVESWRQGVPVEAVKDE